MENLEKIRRANEAFARSDKAAWLDSFDPDVVMIPAREWPESTPTRGTEALWDFYGEVTQAWEGVPFEMTEVIEAGASRVVINLRFEGRGKASGAEFEFNYWLVSTFRNGRQIRIEWFSSRDEALEAAGLSE